ncbi:MAG TPA: hypothetical protein VFI96_01875 [Longimicrobiaceae bacterium]|nr:hypothetical protein [Longimicrobiaceae bacterium]
MQTLESEGPLAALLERSRATAAFGEALRRFLQSGRPEERLRFDPHRSPPIKVARTLTMLLSAHPELEIDRVELDADSGCELYRGVLTAHTPDGARRIDFEWNCRWRALEQGWTDYFGFPDQSRAAREFGHDCFRVWEIRPEES